MKKIVLVGAVGFVAGAAAVLVTMDLGVKNKTFSYRAFKTKTEYAVHKGAEAVAVKIIRGDYNDGTGKQLLDDLFDFITMEEAAF
jgi:hypothetical protein